MATFRQTLKSAAQIVVQPTPSATPVVSIEPNEFYYTDRSGSGSGSALDFDTAYTCTYSPNTINVGGINFRGGYSPYQAGTTVFSSQAAALLNTNWIVTNGIGYGVNASQDDTYWVVIKDSVGTIVAKSITTACIIPPTPSVTPTPSTTPNYGGTPPTDAYFALANVYRCSITSITTQTGDCGDYLGQEVIYRTDRDYVVGLYYTGSDPAKIYQPVKQPYPYDANATKVDSYSVDSCDQACTPSQCSSGSIVTFNPGGYISYITCAGNTVYVQLDCSGSYTINECHICSSIVGSTGPNGTGNPATITSIICGFDCAVPPTPSVSPSRTPSVTPSLTPSVTKTPSVTPTPTPSISPSIAPSPSVSAPPPISPSCTCPAGYTGSYDGTTCISSSTAPATVISGTNNRAWYGGSSLAWGGRGVRIYNANTFNDKGYLLSNQEYAYSSSAAQLAVNGYYIWPVFPNTSSITPDLFWANRLNTVGIWDSQSQFWPGTLQNQGPGAPYPGYLEVCKVIYVPTASTYYFGLGGDNRPVLKINGVQVIDMEYNTPSLEANFEHWNIYGFNLNAGPNLIEVGNYNYNLIGNYACEIYNNTLAQLLNATTESALNIVFSTGEFCAARTPEYWAYSLTITGGPYVSYDASFYPAGPRATQRFCTNYTCPTGFTLDLNNAYDPICRKVDYLTNVCAPSVTPSITVSPSVTPSVTVTPTTTPSVSSTPCPTVSVSPTPSITVTPSLSPDCLSSNCYQSIITNDNSYFYYTCTGVYVTGSNGRETRICVDISRPRSTNLGYFFTSSQCECCPAGTFHPYAYSVYSNYYSGSIVYLDGTLAAACSASAKFNASQATPGSGWNGHSDLTDLYSGSILYYAQSSCRTGSLGINGYYPYKQTTTGTTYYVAQFQNGVVISKPIC